MATRMEETEPRRKRPATITETNEYEATASKQEPKMTEACSFRTRPASKDMIAIDRKPPKRGEGSGTTDPRPDRESGEIDAVDAGKDQLPYEGIALDPGIPQLQPMGENGRTDGDKVFVGDEGSSAD